MTDMLRTICDATMEAVIAERQRISWAMLDEQVDMQGPVRPFGKALMSAAQRTGAAFITEIKKASPSAGPIRSDFDPAALARAYEEGEAACLSVLTEPRWFEGCADDLIAARGACALPVLRKDFMVDPWQVAQSRAMGADCILIIMAAVDDDLARALYDAADDYGMDVLVETHDQAELERALRLPAALIGVNSRNLKTLRTDLDAAAELLRVVPADRFAISESGIRTASDVAKMTDAGAKAFLVGESLLKQHSVSDALRSLKA